MNPSRRALFRLAFDEPGGPANGVDSTDEPASRIVWQAARRSELALAAGPQVAKVLPFSCLNSGADFCATCVERCPEAGAIHAEGRRIVVDPDRCTGCGECVAVCPAPGGAILLAPAS